MAFNRDSTLDISLGTGSWGGGCSDGTTLWFVDDTVNWARAYVAATRARDSAKDIDFEGSGAWNGGLSDGTTLWFVDDAINEARAYVAATRARDSAKDIALGTGIWSGGLSDGTTLWFVDNESDEARAYVAATRARDSAKDIALGTGGWSGGFSDGTTLWFTRGGTDDDIIAYLASDQSRQAADDITHADLAGILEGGVYANGIAWFVEPDANTAIGFRQTTPTVDHAVDAGDAAYAFALPQPTVTHTAAPTAQLVLSDSDDTGLEVVAKALLAASAAATVAGNIFWADADRAGTDTPLDGELGLGANNTVISRFRRVSATVLVLNDNDNPSAFDIGAYFNTGGGGNDLTLYFQTLSGEVSFSVATQLVNQGGAFAQFTLPAAAQTLLDGIASGDRFIFKAARPSTTPTGHAVDAGDSAFAFQLPQPTVTHTTAATTDHAVNAGDAAFAFALPQPTVTYTPATPSGVVSVTVPLTGVSVFTNYIRWSDNQSLGSLFSADGGEQTLTTVDLNSGSPSGQVFISLIGTDNRFTPAFEASGTIIFEASDGETLEVMIADADMSEPYMWVPLASLFEVVAFVNHIRTLVDQTGTLTLRGVGGGVTDHAVNAGDASLAFAVPQPTVTHVPVATVDHTVNAGDAAFAFSIPQPTVTLTSAVPVDHAVDAGDSAFAFVLPEPTVTHTSPLLLLSDFSVPAGRTAVFAGLLEIEVSGELVYRDSDIGSLVDGDLIVTSDITFDRVRVRAGPRVTINRAGTGAVSTYLGNNEDGIFHFQDTDGIDTQAVSAILAADRLIGGANLRDADLVSRVSNLVTGDRLIVAFTLPSPTPVDHAVDAGDAAFAFNLPQPTVTHTPAGPMGYAVAKAGDAAFAFDLPQPTVTHVGIFSTATRLTLSTPIPAARGVRVGDLLAFGELGSETIDGLITSVQPRREMSARVTLLPWSSPGVYDSETGPIPPYITGLTALPGSRYVLEINSFRSDESALRREGSILVPGVAVDVKPIGDFRASIEAQVRPASTEAWEAAVIRSRAGGYIELGEVVEGTAYDFRFRWSRGMRLFPGAWVEELNHTIVGQTSPPAALSNFSVSPTLEGFRASWTNPETIDLAGVIVYSGTSTTFANASEAGRTSDNYFLATGLPAGVALNVWVRAVDFGGREGPLSGPLAVTPSAVGSRVYDIGSDSQPASTLGNVGDTAINDAGLYWLKTGSGWQLRGDLTPVAGGEIYFLDTLPPADSFGANGDIAVGPDGRIMEKASGTWSDITLDIPAIAGLTATVTALYLGRLESGGFHSWDLAAAWTAVGQRYLVEIDVGEAPTSLTANDSTWDSFSGTASGPTQYEFGGLSTGLTFGTAIRARRVGAFGQRGPWSYVLYFL